MARCPSCAAKIAWDAAECVACQALFNDGSAWKIEPENWEERQNLERRYAPRAAARPPARAVRPALVLGFCLVGGALLFAIIAMWPAPAPKFTSTREHGVDRRGVPYRLLGTRYETVCSNECGKDSNCTAWTWYLRKHGGGMECAFMSKTGAPRSDACCISGVISRE